MEFITQIFLSVTFLLWFAWYWTRWRHTSSHLPPSPPGLPLIGNWHQLDFLRMHIKLHEWWKQYGGIILLRVFSQKLIILQDVEYIREALFNTEFVESLTNERESFVAKYVLTNDLVFHSYNRKTNLMKKALTKGMKFYGTGVKDVEELILKEIQKITDGFKATNSQPIDPTKDIHEFLCRIILILVIGREVRESKRAVELINKFDANLSYLSNPGLNAILSMFPWLRHLPVGSGKVYQEISGNIRDLKRLILLEEQDNTEEIRGVLGHLREVQRCESELTDACIEDLVLDILAAGVQTTKMHLLSILLVLVHHPEIQKKIQSEIDRIVPSTRTPCLDDQNNMPYTMAVLLESSRFHTPLPLLLPTVVTKDTTFRGYHIPKGSQVLRNVWTVHHDETFWDEPGLIKPERFLDDNGALLPIENPKRKRVLTFGLGRRICPGESFSKRRIFLFVAGLLQRMTILPGIPVEELPPLDSRNFTPGIVQGVKPFRMRAICRDTL